MSSTAALTETITGFSFGKSMPNILSNNKTESFWDGLSSAEKQECIRKDRSVSIDGKTAWITQGKVQQKWRDLIFPSIEKILKTHEAKIFQPCNGRIIVFDVNIYMRGSLEMFRPTVVASCAKLKVAKMILKLVRDHLKSTRLGFDYLAVNDRITLTTGDPSDISPFSLTHNACGVPISIRYDAGGSHNIKAATIGGCLHVGSKCYGLTAAHILFADSNNGSDMSQNVEDESLECCEVYSDISDLDDFQDSHSTSLRSSASIIPEESSQEYFWRSDSPQFQLSEHDPLLWDLVTQVRELENYELDWLLIPLEAENRQYENRVQFKGRDICLNGVMSEPPNDTVILVAGQSGSRILKASSSLGGIFIPSARRLLKTWSIFHEENAITYGDSGSWAISESGGVYGFLVGTNEERRVSYVTPMGTTIDAICAQNPDAEVWFPGLAPDSQREALATHDTEPQTQFSRSPYATSAARISIGRAARAASWLDDVRAQSIEPGPSERLRDYFDADQDWSEDDEALSDNHISLGSEREGDRSSATSSMIFSVDNQSRRADDDLALAYHDDDIEPSPANLTSVLSIVPDIRGTNGDREKLDLRYYKRPNAERFFAVGRVFAFLSHETVEEGKPGKGLGTVMYITGGKDGKRILSRIRRLVVIQQCDGYCVAIPIDTYNGQGLLKNDLSDAERQAHAVVYGSDTTPRVKLKERSMTAKEPIAIDLSGAEQKLDKFSRLNFGKTFTVQWDVKVMNIGKVAAKSLPVFTRYSLNTLENLQPQINVPGEVTDINKGPSLQNLPLDEPKLLRGLGENFIYDSEQGAMDRIVQAKHASHEHRGVHLRERFLGTG